MQDDRLLKASRKHATCESGRCLFAGGAVSLLIGRPEAKQNGPGSHRGPGVKQEACGCDSKFGETTQKRISSDKYRAGRSLPDDSS